MFLLGCATGCGLSYRGETGVLETQNRLLLEQNRIQTEELAKYRTREEQLASKLKQAEIELAEIHARLDTIRR
ncbi:MAG: hypothetical protein SFX18_11625 [Pirellulales bacterium]|nr:hypothetical protein [Pirellulales bacterium]